MSKPDHPAQRARLQSTRAERCSAGQRKQLERLCRSNTARPLLIDRDQLKSPPAPPGTWGAGLPSYESLAQAFALAERDPEEARALLEPVVERMMEAVHHYDGTVNQVMGDGIMALFGAPLAQEDHAVRGCYAALRMQDAVRRYAEQLFASHGVPVEIRVGLNSGEVVVGGIGSDLRMEYTAVGQTTHLAARMEQMALPGTALMTAATLALAEGYVSVKPRGRVPVKGLAEPVEVFELAGAGVARTRLQAATARGLTKFVGRDAEVDQLNRALERAGGGHGQIVAVVGEPGVGKSRLFYEFTHSHRLRDWVRLLW